MSKLTYKPINEDQNEPITKADLENLFTKLQSLYIDNEVPEKIIHIDQSSSDRLPYRLSFIKT